MAFIGNLAKIGVNNLIDFGHFYHIFCKFLKRHIQKKITTCKISLTPTTKEPKICHALVITSAFNLKMCHMGKFEKKSL